MVIPDLSKLFEPQQKINVGQTRRLPQEMLKENKFGNAPTRTIHDLKRSQNEKQRVELVPHTDHSTKSDLSNKTTDELLNEIRDQQIEQIKYGLYPKCKAVTRPEKNTSSKRPRDQPQRPPSPPRRPVTTGLFILLKSPRSL